VFSVYITKNKNTLLKVKVKNGKGKFVPVLLTKQYTMKAYWGSGIIAPRILRPCHYMEAGGQFHDLTALLPGNGLLVPVE
jgi:hypothetical protein